MEADRVHPAPQLLLCFTKGILGNIILFRVATPTKYSVSRWAFKVPGKAK
jgi:hypothetical protein